MGSENVCPNTAWFRIIAIQEISTYPAVLSGRKSVPCLPARLAGNIGSCGGIADEFRGMANLEADAQTPFAGVYDLHACDCGARVKGAKLFP